MSGNVLEQSAESLAPGRGQSAGDTFLALPSPLIGSQFQREFLLAQSGNEITLGSLRANSQKIKSREDAGRWRSEQVRAGYGWGWAWKLTVDSVLEKEMAAHSSILSWRIPWTEEPGRLQSLGWPRVGQN